MATFTAVQTGGASADYMKYLYNGLSKDDRTSEPKLVDFSLVPWDGSFVKLTRGAYITLTTSTYGTWYTGFVTNDPELEFLGGKAGAGQWGYKVQATSDEYLLNLKNIGIVPPFINTDQGTILKYLVRILTPAGYTFDVSGIGVGQKIPRYVIDPSKKFSDVVKEFADSANYRFWAIGMALHFVQRDSIACGIIVDGNSKHFTPSNLKLAPTSDSIINDVVVTGQTEPQNYITEYFVGDGFTGNIPMMSSVFGADSSLLLDDDFSSSQTDLTKWTVFDTAANFLQVNNGFLNALGGNNNNTFDVYYQSANLIPLEGNLRITHGEYDFVNSASRGVNGIISGLWTGTPARTGSDVYPGCIYGIRVFNQTNLIPDSDEVSGSTFWTQDASLPIVNGVGAIRGNGWVYTGTGAASAFHFNRSATITVTPLATYTISGYVDASHVTSGGPGIAVEDTSITTGYGSAAQTAGVNGRISATFTVPAGVTQVKVIFDTNNCIVASGQPLTFSNPQLELGSTATPYETNNTGAMDTRLVPVANGVLDRSQWAVVDFTKRYILRTVAYHRQVIRYLRQYSYFALGGAVGFFGGTAVVDIVDFQTYITEIDPTTAAITNQYVWANLSLSLGGGQTFAYYCPVVSNDLHCTVTGITLSTPMQAALWIKKSGTSAWVNQIVGRNEIDSFDGLTPVATVTDQNNGVTTKSSLLGTSQYNSAQAVLQFFHDTTKQTSQIPQPGDQVYFRYRRPGAAIARVQDKVSIAAEATAWGDNGLRSLTNTSLSPLPRVSAECEFAAASIVKYTSYQHYQGTYTMERTPFITGVFTAEPLSGTVLKFQNLPASFPSYLQAEIVSQVQTTFDHSIGGECFTHSISFGSVDPAIGAVARLRRTDDVFNPQDSIEVPSYIDVSSVGNTFVPDVVAPTLDSYDSTTLHFNTNQALINQNILLQTAALSGAPWSPGQLTSVTDNSATVLDPIGGHTATKLVCNGGTDPTLSQNITGFGVLAGQSFTGSVWVLGSGATIGKTCTLFMYNNDVTEIHTQDIVLTGDWQRVKLSVTWSTTNTSFNFRIDPVNLAPFASGDTVYVWGPQCQTGLVVTDYIANGASRTQVGGFEVRYTDESWGADSGKNLVTRSNTTLFTVPRNTRGKVCFVKQYDTRNKIPFSEDLTSASWTKDGSTVASAAAKNPDGKWSQISTLTPVSGNKRAYCFTGVVASLLPVTASAWVKGTAGDTAFLIIGNNVTQNFSTTMALNGKWQHFTVSGTFDPAGSSSSDTVTSNLFCQISLGASPLAVTRVNVELNTLTETIYCKTNGSAYGAMSRFAAGIKVGYPLVPPSPTATINVSNPILPVLNVVLPAALTDVWGIEIRASNNSTVLIHIDLTDASFVTSWVMPTNASRSPSYFVYTYNLLGEYSTAYNATASLPAPSASSVTTDEATMRVKWNMTFTLPIVETLFEIATDSGYTNIIYSDNGSGVSGTLLLGPSDFFPQRYFRVTPYDALGAGTSATGNHVYTPTGVVEFNGNEVAVIPAPATPTTDPVVPTPLNDYPRDVVDAGWGNYKGNRLRYF